MLTRTNDAVDMNCVQQHEQMDGGSAHERVRDQSYIKQYNLQTVMAILKKYQPISRTDIARMTGMSPTSVTRIVSALLNHGLIHECSAEIGAEGEQHARRGRKAVYLRVRSSGLYAVGIHLERSVVRLCVTDFSNSILYRSEGLVDGECTPESMARQAKLLFDRMPAGIIEDMSRVGAVGVCLSGSVDNRTGEVRRSCRMEWENESVREAFERVFALPVCVENEVKACLIGEKVRLDIRDEVDTVYLYIGEEVGAAIVSNGMIVRGRQNDAGNIAGLSVKPGSGEGSSRLWMHLSEKGILQQAQEKDPSVRTTDMLFALCRQGEDWALELVKDFAHHASKTVAVICGLFDPQKIILGGDLVRRAVQYFDVKIEDERICFGGSFAEGCMSGAALIALREAVVERIGQSAE